MYENHKETHFWHAEIEILILDCQKIEKFRVPILHCKKDEQF